MRSKLSISSALFLFLILDVLCPLTVCRADSPNDYDKDGVKKTYYWEGNKINNLSGRLGTGSDFEGEERRTQEGKDKDQYLATIREKMSNQAQADAQTKATLRFQGQLPGNPIELTYLSPGLRITLHAEALFDENTAMLKAGSLDTLDRLQTILQAQASQQPLQLVIADKMDDLVHANDLDAERSLVILHRLQSSPENRDQ